MVPIELDDLIFKRAVFFTGLQLEIAFADRRNDVAFFPSVAVAVRERDLAVAVQTACQS